MFSKFKKILMTVAISLPLVFGAMAVQAAPIGLALVLDGSGSISSTEFNIQRTGYINALNNVLPTDGSIAVGLYQFSSFSQVEFAFQVINNATDLSNLVNALTNMNQLGGGTNIGTGIDQAAAQMAAFGYGNLDRAVVDVSTDGFSSGTPLNNATSFVTAAQAGTILGEGAVNCLGIGAGANCNFETGDDSFEIIANTFADVESALTVKIQRELNLVSEPGTLMLLGVGLLGLALRRRMVA